MPPWPMKRTISKRPARTSPAARWTGAGPDPPPREPPSLAAATTGDQISVPWLDPNPAVGLPASSASRPPLDSAGLAGGSAGRRGSRLSVTGAPPGAGWRGGRSPVARLEACRFELDAIDGRGARVARPPAAVGFKVARSARGASTLLQARLPGRVTNTPRHPSAPLDVRRHPA